MARKRINRNSKYLLMVGWTRDRIKEIGIKTTTCHHWLIITCRTHLYKFKSSQFLYQTLTETMIAIKLFRTNLQMCQLFLKTSQTSVTSPTVTLLNSNLINSQSTSHKRYPGEPAELLRRSKRSNATKSLASCSLKTGKDSSASNTVHKGMHSLGIPVIFRPSCLLSGWLGTCTRRKSRWTRW